MKPAGHPSECVGPAADARAALVDDLAQSFDVGGKTPLRQRPDRRDLEDRSCGVDIGERRATQLQEDGRLPDHHERVGRAQHRAAVHPADRLDQGLGLKDAHRLAEGRARHGVGGEQLLLRRQRLTGYHLTGDELHPDVVREHLRHRPGAFLQVAVELGHYANLSWR